VENSKSFPSNCGNPAGISTIATILAFPQYQVHMEGFTKMLHEEALNFNQFIVTTHYRSWRDRYKYARGAYSNIQLIELMPWSLSRGIRHTKTKIIVDDLVEKCNEDEFDRQAVTSQAGIILESLLDFLTMKYRCKLPRKSEPDYTLAELMNGLDKKLRSMLKIEKYNGNGLNIKSIWSL
jgi:hypothetical protein